MAEISPPTPTLRTINNWATVIHSNGPSDSPHHQSQGDSQSKPTLNIIIKAFRTALTRVAKGVKKDRYNASVSSIYLYENVCKQFVLLHHKETLKIAHTCSICLQM